jgi:hypothetical protein
MWRQSFPEKDRPFLLMASPHPFFFFPVARFRNFAKKKITVANPLTYLTKLKKKKNKTVATILFFGGVFLVFKNKKLTRNAPKTHEIRNRLRATRVV